LIAVGHPPDAVWGYTPAQASAFITLAGKRAKKDRAFDLSVAAMAQRSKADDINKRIKEWNSG